MNNLKDIVKQIAAYGHSPPIVPASNTIALRRLLAEVYLAFLSLETTGEPYGQGEPPERDSKEVLKNVKVAFPDFTFYQSVWDSHKLNYPPEVLLGDALDDISDIVLDMMEVEWYFNNTSEENAIFYFCLLMKIHSEFHLVCLLKYLKDREE